MVAQVEPSSTTSTASFVHDISPGTAAGITTTVTSITTTSTIPTSDEDKAAVFLAQAPSILQAIDDAHIIIHSDHEQRAVPKFVWDEMTVGAFLGEGGYGMVYEVSKIVLQSAPDHDTNDNDNNDELRRSREFMEHHCRRHGMARYALKRNKTASEGLSRVHHRARGRIDLAVEAKYLSTVSHPNIIKLRGIGQGPLVDEHFFILLDRLETTLDVQMRAWGKEQRDLIRQQSKAPWWRKRTVLRKTQGAMQDLMVRRLTVALDLAKAFHYLHEHRVLYRDVKATNIGFDVRGDVKIFDFGFCKSLCPTLKAEHDAYGYNLTPRVGSFPYMAPEVFKKEPYDSKCDVFSFAVLLWEMLSLQLAWTDYTPQEFVHRVFYKDERALRIMPVWPPLTRLSIIPQGWDPSPPNRPTMQRIAQLLHGDLKDITTDETVLHRTRHMGGRTQHSIELENDVEDDQRK